MLAAGGLARVASAAASAESDEMASPPSYVAHVVSAFVEELRQPVVGRQDKKRHALRLQLRLLRLRLRLRIVSLPVFLLAVGLHPLASRVECIELGVRTRADRDAAVE